MFCISRPETATYGIAANSTISKCFDEGNLHLVGPTSDAFHISILMSVALVTERKYPSFKISFYHLELMAKRSSLSILSRSLPAYRLCSFVPCGLDANSSKNGGWCVYLYSSLFSRRWSQLVSCCNSPECWLSETWKLCVQFCLKGSEKIAAAVLFLSNNSGYY